ncbi:methyl-accepting chemotaxis protein [Solibacillus sp. FSL R5-0449]|uniref:methyl-accepting chemotaxis protein n=1 Tax=Solibacillus sp. FSL R5-0449 TaxID=2921639 RepID=UPI0030D4A7B5
MQNRIESLGALISMISVMKEAIPTELSIAVCDLEKFIAYFPAKDLDLKIQVGQQLNHDEPLMIALKKGRRLEAVVPADYYGFEFIGTATPLYDQTGKTIGGIAVQVRKHSELIEISQAITGSLTNANEQIVNIAGGSTSLKESANELLQQSKQAEKNVQHTSEILSLLKRMADQTNLLGLNAAIEAARAGEKGKGFEVVATEIRKFSKETIESTQKIRETMDQINEATQKITTSIAQISTIGTLQSESIQQVSDFVKEIQVMSTQLNEYANKL